MAKFRYNCQTGRKTAECRDAVTLRPDSKSAPIPGLHFTCSVISLILKFPICDKTELKNYNKK